MKVMTKCSILSCCVLVGQATFSWGDVPWPKMAPVPMEEVPPPGPRGYDLEVKGGDTIEFEVWLGDTCYSPTAGSWQVTFDCWCGSPFFPFPELVAGRIDFVDNWVDPFREDYIFYGLTTSGPVANQGQCEYPIGDYWPRTSDAVTVRT